MRKLLLLFLCCEWIPIFRWRMGFGYAVPLLLVYLVKLFALAQLPQAELYVGFLLISQLLLGLQLLVSAGGTLFRQFAFLSPGATFLNLFGKTRFTLLSLQPFIALAFALLCLYAIMEDDLSAEVLLATNSQSLMMFESYQFWESIGRDAHWVPMALTPLISAIALRYYNQTLFETTKEAFVETATKQAAPAPKKPPTGATVAGSAITFPKVSGVSQKAKAPSLETIGRSFR